MNIKTRVDSGGLTRGKIAMYAIIAIAVIVLPLYFQSVQNYFFVRIFAVMGIYVMLALGLNIVVGYAATWPQPTPGT